MSSKMVVVTGRDGAGKSTLLSQAQRSIQELGKKVHICTIWDNLKRFPLKSKSEIQSYLTSLNSQARLLFLAHAMMNSLEESYKVSSDLVLVDSYIYKYLVNERARGVSAEFGGLLLKMFPEPDVTFFLELNSEKAFQRKSEISSYESNGEFIDFQNRMDPYWHQYQLENPQWISIDAMLSPEEVHQQFVTYLQRLWE